ncbi:hypothetical protein [Alkalilimnicola sp. S0819]|uniref:hypothetical protein n=1 Tax=Alkalilimnicola sp. S0819 TaxID=2613922 RepID=UPI001262051D|nr:hypothetical protein [Alkalilimnicola sp. S0819]KAB7624157.1 hypothetical protein F3N43_07145 [Alkalilimnicola sp. S0819]MPQ16410.1 hypothetical protein [Alkalilimnicola sp. S0819]
MNPARAVSLTGDAIAAYNSMKAASADPESLAKEIAKWSPDIVLRVIAHDAGRALPLGNYFLGAGFNVLDPNVWKGIALMKLRIEIDKLYETAAVDFDEMTTLRVDLGRNPARAHQMIIVYKLRQRGRTGK